MEAAEGAPELSRILLVEDDLDIQMVARLALEDLGGLSVEICSSGFAALEKAPRFHPDLILLDVMMPELDGPGTFQALSRIPEVADTPVVFMTARARLGEVEEYRRLGALDVIVKPFDPMKLAETVHQIWRRYHAERECGD